MDRNDEKLGSNPKLQPAASASLVVARPRLRDRLDAGLAGRLITVVAGPGFGKSTLLARWTAERPCAWYHADARDASLGVLVSGLTAALRPFMPRFDEALSLVNGPRGPDSENPEIADAIATHLCDAIQLHLRHDLVVVIDDAHEIGANGQSARLLAGLCRHAPPTLHLVLSSRLVAPFAIERLRGRGEVLEIGGAELAFDLSETTALLTETLGGVAEAWADRIQEVTDGWPAAVRLTLEQLRSAPPERRALVLQGMRQPGGTLFSYLAGEVFSNELEPVRDLIRLVAPLDRFSADLCDALGAEGAAELLADLCRRSMFVRPDGPPGWFSLHSLVRDFVGSRWPIDLQRAALLHQRAAKWMDEHGYPEEALRSLMASGDPPELAALLAKRGPSLLASGLVDSVISACAAVARTAGGAKLALLEGEARQIGGDWDGALASYQRAVGGDVGLPAGIAWRMGRIHYLRGEHAASLEVYRRAATEGCEPRDQAQLFAWQATAHWMRGEMAACRQLAIRALELAAEEGDDLALSAAHNVLGLLAAADGDLQADLAHYVKALHHAEQAGDLVQVIRVRANMGSRLDREGRYREAVVELDEVIRLADLTGFAAFRAVGLANRGQTRLRLGRLDEAISDCSAAAAVCRRIGSTRECWALGDLGDIHRERGDLTVARGFYERAVTLADRTGEAQGLVVALSGLARTVARDDPDEARRLAERAVELGVGIRLAVALLAAGWVALSRGERDVAASRAEAAMEVARDRSDRAALAEAVELSVLAAPDPATDASRLEESVAIWRDLGNPLGEARAMLVAGLLGSGPEARGQARRAEHQLQLLGVRTRAQQAAGPLSSLTRHQSATLMIRTLGRFEVVRDGEPVGPSGWQSRKARDLLKVLVSLRGRPITREALMETLWPDGEFERLSNRLSVALATVRTVLDPNRRHGPDHYVAADAAAVRLSLSHLQLDIESFLADASTGLRWLIDGRTEDAIELLLAADAAYTGDFLEEDPYEDWAVARREEARATYIGVVRALAHHAIGVRDHDGAVRYSLRLLERDPFDEEAHLGLVVTLENNGRRGEARRRYRTYVSAMEEIAVEPAPFPMVVPASP